LINKPTYLHLSTHGSFDWSNILESGLDLSKGQRLTLGNLLSEPDKLIGSRLVVLSACETGLVDLEVPAESLGLPAAFMQAGTPGIISTLWTVDEISTMFLMGKFYELHLGELQIEPPRALALAQEWLRTATYQTLRDWLSPMVIMMKKTKSPQFSKTFSELEKLRSMIKHQLTNQPYQELYYWAGFVYSGA
jgi:CHAT domain-containing protein